MPDTTELLDVVTQVATAAADVVADGYDAMRAGLVDVDTKSSATDVVTTVDTETERFIRSRLAALRPDDGVLGEEDGGVAGSSGVEWVVDPIDGTVNFVHGHPNFAVCVAAQIDGESVAGAVVEPVSRRVWTAARGSGAWLDGAPLRLAAPRPLELAVIATGYSYQRERRRRQADTVSAVVREVGDIRRGGSAALDLCATAAGWVDGYFEHGLGRWDWAAASLVASEAGARVVLPGTDARLGADDGILAAHPDVAEQLIELLERAGVASI